MKTEEKSDMQKYFLLKKDIDLPVKVKLYFLIFENAIDQTKAPRSLQSKKGFSKALLSAFSNLSNAQKGMFLLSNINFVLQQMDRQEKEKTKSDSKVETDDIRNIQTTCEMLMTTLKINHWTTVSIKIDKLKKSILITNKKKNFPIDIKNYFVRRSNKYKATIVLEAITQQINNQAKKYAFCFSSQVVGKIYQEMLKCVYACQHEKILSMMIDEDQQDKDSHKSGQKALVFLSSNNINNYLSYKEKVQKQIMQNKFQFKTLYAQDRLKIEQSHKMEKIFKLQNVFDVDSKELKQKFVYAHSFKNKFIKYSQVLEEFSKKYKAIYQKLSVNGKIYDYISIREESISNQQQILFVKGIQNVMGKNYIQFLQVRVRTVNPCQSKLIIYLSISLSAVITKQAVKAFLIEFNDMIFRKQQKIIHTTSMNENDESCTTTARQTGEAGQVQDDFMTMKGSSDQHVVDFQQDDGQIDLQTSSPTSRNRKIKQIQQIQHFHSAQTQYLFCKHFQEPIDAQKFHKFMQKHYLFDQWVRVKSGGVVCTNQDVVDKQKKLFKEGITKLGRQILKGQILKMSLPVIIFRKQSHLQTIARNFCYAPMFFDKLAKNGDSLQRVKYATLLAISVGTLGICMEKPFNPILGQTMQLRIDGCPIYLQQITHHPPVGAYFFEGRGYKIHGQIQPKVAFGLNNIKGYSNRPNFIQFNDDGTQIQINFGKMVINGMMFGDRSFNFEDKIYAYDKKNHIFSQIIYGARKRSVTKKNHHDPCDFIHGSIYKLKPEFLAKFDKSMPRIFPTKQYIISELSTFQGIWNDEIKFDDKPYINFFKELPHQLIHEDYPLLSNSTYRKDLIRLIEDNIPQAQKQKQILQQIQRRDKKLRQKYHLNHHH